MQFRRLSVLLLAALLPWGARAQFSSSGSEPARTRWSAFRTQDYELLYPRGLDSLASVYGRLLQQYRIPVSRSAGYLPNQQYRRPMPVVLHAQTGYSNGAVVWAPRRMDLFTVPDAYGQLSPMPWAQMLAIHENRHVAQLQFSSSGFWSGFRYPMGELAPMLVNLFANAAFLEGDAVVAETALTASGRGRSGDFLGYMRMAFDNGDFRDWNRWRHGSIKWYTPDYYRVGYMTIAGFRYRYDAPMFMADYLETLSHPFGFVNARAVVAGKYSRRSFDTAWSEITKTFHEVWAQEDSLRGPFLSSEPIVRKPRSYTVYSGSVPIGGDVVAAKAGMDLAPELVRISQDGKEKTLSAFGGSGKIAWSAPYQRIYWAEAHPDIRWPLKQDSRIRYRNIDSREVFSLTGAGRYYNPAVSGDGLRLCAVEYPQDGSSAIVVLSPRDGTVLRRWTAPAGLQVTEAVFQGEDLVFAGITEGGSGLYRLAGERLETLLAPCPVSMKDLSAADDETVLFTSDRTGVNEAYAYSGGRLRQLSVTKYGLSFPFYRDGKLYASVLLPEGRLLSRVDESSQEVDFQDVRHNPIADTLSAQERRLALAPAREGEVRMSTPEPYSKAKHFLHFHSWLPLYTNMDRFTTSYRDYYFNTASWGATGFFQNLTGTVSGTIGLSLHEKVSPEEKTPGVGVHFRMTYSGLFPVFDIALDVGDRDAANQVPYLDEAKDSVFIRSSSYGKAFVGGKIAMSFPMDFSSGGWERTLEPTLSFSMSNDDLSGPYVSVEGTSPTSRFTSTSHRLSATLRGRSVRPVAPSRMMPTLGAGFEAGVLYVHDFFTEYGKVYGYLPGLRPRHATKVSALVRNISHPRFSFWYEDPCPPAPRGYASVSGLNTFLSYAAPIAGRLSVEYTMPVLPMDWSVGTLFYVRNLEIVPFADWTVLGFVPGLEKTGFDLWSVGTDVAVNLQRLLIVSTNLSLGVRVAYNGGTSYPFLSQQGTGLKPYYVGAVFNTEF